MNEKKKKYNKRYYKNNADEIKKQKRDYYKKNAKQIKAKWKKYRDENIEKLKIQKKIYIETHKDEIKKRNKEYCKTHKKEIREYRKKYYQANILKLREYERKRQNSKRKNNLDIRLNRNMSRVINHFLHGRKNGRSWEGLVNYTFKELKIHLESQFKEGMTWDNYGRNGWHIDHKIPISLFNITSAKCKGFKKCWALANLQPLWEKDNLGKSNKIFC